MSRPCKLPITDIVEAYKRGDSAHVLAARYNCTAPGILKLLRREGALVRSRGNKLHMPFSLYKELANINVFVVNQDNHHVDAYVANGMSHGEATKVMQRHQAEQGKPAIYIWKDELDCPGLQRMVEHRNLTDQSEKIYARNCVLGWADMNEARLFYDQWHLQGSPCRVEHTATLSYNGEVVAMMSFNSPKACRGVKVPWMLQRYACVGRVPGAASKLLSTFRNAHPGNIVSYSDNRYSPLGGLYKVLGFELRTDGKPDYRYWRDGRWYAKSSKQRKDLIAEIEQGGGVITSEDTEYTMARRLGYKRCYDAGKKTWVL